MPFNKNSSVLQGFCVAIILWAGALAMNSVHAVRLSPLAGQGVLGSPLQVHADLEGLSSSNESQLRSTCMRASFSVAGADRLDSQSLPMNVEFLPTVQGKGRVRLSSRGSLTEPMGTVRLVSECPLAVFDVSWSVLMEPASGSGVPLERWQAPVASAEQSASDFNLTMADTGARSGGAEPRIARMSVPKADKLTPEPAPATKDIVEPSLLVEGRDELALLDTTSNVADSSRNVFVPTQPGHEPLVLSSSKSPSNAVQLEQIPLLIGSSAALLLGGVGGFWWFRGRRMALSARSEGWSGSRPSQRPVDAIEPFWTVSQIKDTVDDVPPDALDSESNRSDLSNALLMGSFLGADLEPVSASHVAVDSTVSVSVLNPPDQQSIAAALAQVNKAEVCLWNLPGPYASLVAGRNSALALSAQPNAKWLRAQIGLVELAFQEAKRGRMLEKASGLVFLEAMLGELNLEGFVPELGWVPDVVKGHLSAKFCEVSGSETKLRLKQNCLALSKLAQEYPVCFASEDWAQWVEDSCVGT